MTEITFQLTEAERQKFIEQYQPYVRKLASQAYRKTSGKFDMEDLVAYGTLGLVEAAERYNPQRGVSFITFCHYRIKGAIFDGLRQMGLPAPRVKRVINWEAHANRALQAALDDETSDAQNVTVKDEVERVQNLIETLIPTYLLSLESDEAKNAPDTRGISAQEEIEKTDLINLVHRIVEELPEAERELLDSIYFKHITMTQIAADKGITKSWVSRLHYRAVQHIREKLNEIGFFIDDSS